MAKSLLSIYPMSAYLWTLGIALVGFAYMAFPDSVINNDIPLIYDRLWGMAVMLTGAAMIVVMRNPTDHWVKILSGILFLASVMLLIPSIVTVSVVAIVMSSLSMLFYGYTYLCSSIVLDWQLIEQIRTDILYGDSIEHKD